LAEWFFHVGRIGRRSAAKVTYEAKNDQEEEEEGKVLHHVLKAGQPCREFRLQRVRLKIIDRDS